MPDDGSGDYRVPALTVEVADGSASSRFGYVEHRVRAGKPGRPPEDGLPVTYVESDEEADALEIVLADERSGLAVELSYTVFGDRPVVARGARTQHGATPSG